MQEERPTKLDILYHKLKSIITMGTQRKPFSAGVSSLSFNAKRPLSNRSETRAPHWVENWACILLDDSVHGALLAPCVTLSEQPLPLLDFGLSSSSLLSGIFIYMVAADNNKGWPIIPD